MTIAVASHQQYQRAALLLIAAGGALGLVSGGHALGDVLGPVAPVRMPELVFLVILGAFAFMLVAFS